MANTSNFALRMPPKMKEAATALTKTFFNVWDSSGDGIIEGVSPQSINDAILYLMRTGLQQTLGHLDKQIVREKPSYDALYEIVTFFMNNPLTSHALPENFPKGSNARRYITELMDMQPKDFGDGVNRDFAMNQFVFEQAVLSSRVAALGAIKRALASQDRE